MDATSTDGVRVAIHDLGGPADEEAPPVLLIAHATGFHGRVYGPMASAGLTARFRCLAPDLRGHGDGSVPDDLTFEWRGFGDDIGAVLATIGDRVVYGFGHSMGGAALVLAEAAVPGTFAGLYLFEPIIPPPGLLEVARPNPMAEAAERRREMFESFDAAYANYAGKPPLDVMTPAALRAYVDYGFEPVGDDGSVRLKCRGAVEAATFRMSGGHDAFSRLDDVKCPVTVAMGEATEFGPPAFAPAIVDALPHGRLDRFPHLGHFAPMQAPDEIAAAIIHAFTFAF